MLCFHFPTTTQIEERNCLLSLHHFPWNSHEKSPPQCIAMRGPRSSLLHTCKQCCYLIFQAGLFCQRPDDQTFTFRKLCTRWANWPIVKIPSEIEVASRYPLLPPVDTVDTVCTVGMVYTVDMVYIVSTVYTIQTVLHCLNSSMYA